MSNTSGGSYADDSRRDSAQLFDLVERAASVNGADVAFNGGCTFAELAARTRLFAGVVSDGSGTMDSALTMALVTSRPDLAAAGPTQLHCTLSIVRSRAFAAVAAA